MQNVAPVEMLEQGSKPAASCDAPVMLEQGSRMLPQWRCTEFI
jgi:hypothetical protein